MTDSKREIRELYEEAEKRFGIRDASAIFHDTEGDSPGIGNIETAVWDWMIERTDFSDGGRHEAGVFNDSCRGMSFNSKPRYAQYVAENVAEYSDSFIEQLEEYADNAGVEQPWEPLTADCDMFAGYDPFGDDTLTDGDARAIMWSILLFNEVPTREQLGDIQNADSFVSFVKSYHTQSTLAGAIYQHVFDERVPVNVRTMFGEPSLWDDTDLNPGRVEYHKCTSCNAKMYHAVDSDGNVGFVHERSSAWIDPLRVGLGHAEPDAVLTSHIDNASDNAMQYVCEMCGNDMVDDHVKIVVSIEDYVFHLAYNRYGDFVMGDDMEAILRAEDAVREVVGRFLRGRLPPETITVNNSDIPDHANVSPQTLNQFIENGHMIPSEVDVAIQRRVGRANDISAYTLSFPQNCPTSAQWVKNLLTAGIDAVEIEN